MKLLRRIISQIWFDDILSIEWILKKQEVGGIRYSNLKTMKIREKILIWDNGKRITLYINESNVPLFKKLAEDFQFESVDENNCIVSWNVYYELPFLLSFLTPLMQNHL